MSRQLVSSLFRVAPTALLATLAVLASGCETDSSSTTPAAKPTVDSWQATQLAGFCTLLERCPQTLSVHFASPATCKSLLAEQMGGGEEVALAKAGKLTFDADQAAACIASLPNITCSDLNSSDGPPACQDIFKGAVANDAACTSDEECTSGHCKYSGGNCGKCAPAIALGEACQGSGCANDGICMDGKCAAKGSVAPGGTCLDGDACSAGHFCQWGEGNSQNTCVALVAKDGACEDSEECQPGLACAPKSASDEDKTCQTPKALGDPCFEPSQPFGGQSPCATGVCGILDGTQSAKCLEWKKMGEACESSWQCGLIDSVCIGKKCVPMPKTGEACADIGFAKLCDMASACDPASGKCVAPPTSGPCLNNRCAEGYNCSCADSQCMSQVCKAPAKAGESCDNGQSECDEGLSCNQQGKCEAMVCM